MMERLEYGDAQWEGYGPRGRVLVGVERKHLTDIVSCIHDGRLAGHQLRGMRLHYDYSYLLLEDFWRPDANGGIEIVRNGKWRAFYSNGYGMTYRQVQSYLTTLETLGGVTVLNTTTMRETAALYASLFHWWQKPWKDHHSHDAIYAPGPDTQSRGKAAFVSKTPGIVAKIASQLPGIDRKAWDVEQRFASVEEMVNASEKEWMEIPGIGKGIAKDVYQALHARAAKA